jgi:hypothetical protein
MGDTMQTANPKTGQVVSIGDHVAYIAKGWIDGEIASWKESGTVTDIDKTSLKIDIDPECGGFIRWIYHDQLI